MTAPVSGRTLNYGAGDDSGKGKHRPTATGLGNRVFGTFSVSHASSKKVRLSRRATALSLAARGVCIQSIMLPESPLYDLPYRPTEHYPESPDSAILKAGFRAVFPCLTPGVDRRYRRRWAA